MNRALIGAGLYEIFHRVSCWCCPLQSLDELRKLHRYFPDLWRQLEAWDDATWRTFIKGYSARDLAARFDFEEQWQKAGGNIRSRAFYAAMREEIQRRRTEVKPCPTSRREMWSKGTVKVIDKSAVAAERMKDAYVRTQGQGGARCFAAESSPEEYAADRTLTGTETAAHEAAHGLDKAGRKGVKTTKENISKAKDYFQRRKADLPKKSRRRTPCGECAAYRYYAKGDQDGRPQRQNHQADGKSRAGGGQDHAEKHQNRRADLPDPAIKRRRLRQRRRRKPRRPAKAAKTAAQMPHKATHGRHQGGGQATAPLQTIVRNKALMPPSLRAVPQRQRQLRRHQGGGYRSASPLPQRHDPPSLRAADRRCRD